MKAIAKKLASRVRSKNIVKENQEEYVRVKRKVLVRVKRRLEAQTNQEPSMLKGNFLATVKQVLVAQRFKNTFNRLREKFSFETFMTRNRGNDTEGLLEEDENVQSGSVEVIIPSEELEQQNITLYMPLQF